MTNETQPQFRVQTILQGLQLIVLVIGVATVFTTVGKKEQIITHTAQNLAELENIVHELVKSQVSSATKDSEHDRVLDDLRVRIYKLEQER